MNFSHDLAQPFLHLFIEKDKDKEKDLKGETATTFFMNLYQDLVVADAETTQIHWKQVEEPPKPSAFVSQPSPYFPAAIQQYVLTQQKWCWRGQVGGFTLHLFFFSQPRARPRHRLREQVRRAFVWLAICAKYAQPHCAQKLNISVYLTPFAKTLPASPGSTVLGAEHVNTAYTQACTSDTSDTSDTASAKEIVIYREEEWFKVFLHETLHAFGFDLGATGVLPAPRQRLKKMFPINSKLDVNETYTEVWARCVNCVMESFYASHTKKTFKLYLKFCLQLEGWFAVYQAQKMLEYMGLTFRTFCHAGHYKEDSHVFAYYVLTAAIFQNVTTFLGWCQSNNTPRCLFQFTQTALNQDAFVTFLARQMQHAPLKHLNLTACTPALRQTTRMTLL